LRWLWSFDPWVEGLRRRPMLKSSDLENQLRKWREDRARKHSARPVSNDRRTVRVNGQEVVVITKPKRAVSAE
jgi:hypothetical protein